MKPILCLLLLALLSGCKKEELSFREQLIGTWELQKSYGGLTPSTTDFPSGNGHTKTFTETDYTEYKASQILEYGKYTIVDTVLQGKKGGIMYVDSSLFPYFMYINDSKLILSFLGSDGGGSEYRKLK
jgi:hypothetical protein